MLNDASGSERCVLGALLRDSSMVRMVAARTKSQDFGVPRHAELFKLMLELEERSPGSADIVRVAQHIDQHGLAAGTFDRDGLATLASEVPSTAYVEQHVEEVLNASRRRQLESIVRVASNALSGGEDTDAIARSIDEGVVELLARHGKDATVSMREVVQEVRNDLEERAKQERPSGEIRTTINDLNTRLGGGLFPQDLVVVGARAGMGKTMFAESIAELACTTDPVLMFSLEMPRSQLVERGFKRAIQSTIPRLSTAYGESARVALDATQGAATKLSMLPIYVCDDFDADFARIRGEALAQKRREGLSLLTVDYLQLVNVSKPSRNRQEDVATLSRSFKKLARELNIPVLLLCQLNRESERREGKRPALADLRESGAIEQDADRVLLLHRPSYYDQHSTDSDEVIVAKNRHGESGRVRAFFNTRNLRWTNFEERGSAY